MGAGSLGEACAGSVMRRQRILKPGAQSWSPQLEPAAKLENRAQQGRGQRDGVGVDAEPYRLEVLAGGVHASLRDPRNLAWGAPAPQLTLGLRLGPWLGKEQRGGARGPRS